MGKIQGRGGQSRSERRKQDSEYGSLYKMMERGPEGNRVLGTEGAVGGRTGWWGGPMGRLPCHVECPVVRLNQLV